MESMTTSFFGPSTSRMPRAAREIAAYGSASAVSATAASYFGFRRPATETASSSAAKGSAALGSSGFLIDLS